jgi:hypothetical protein
MNWLKLMFTGQKIMAILTDTVPTALADGKLTIDEITDLVKKILSVFEINAEIKVPDDMKGKYLDVVEKVKPTV